MVKVCNCTSSRFKTLIRSKRIICFCAGLNFYLFCRNYPVVQQLEYVVDNFKAGTVLDIEGRRIPVISMKELHQISSGAVLVLTSVKAADEIIPQMDSNNLFCGRELYIPEIFTEEGSDFKFPAGGQQIIPKIIHYCWFGSALIPKHFQNNIDTWKRCCPDYEIKKWDESNYDISKNIYMQQAYKKKKWGFVPDYARLDIIMEHGGIYLDTDVRMVKSYNPLLQFGMFCGFESKSRVNLGQGFGARKGHPVIRKMRDQYRELSFINPDGSINIEPSPVYQTETLKQCGLVIDGTLQQKENFIVFPPEYFSPVNEFGYGRVTANTFSVHQYAGSWYGESEMKTKEKIIENYSYIMGRLNYVG